MKKIILFLLCLLLASSFSQGVRANSVLPEITAQAAVVMENATGIVMYDFNSHKKLPMASTTKIMTALIALESGRINEKITITKEMATIEGSSMGLLEGDEITLKTLCAGMLLESGNDAANSVGVMLGKTEAEFAKIMNKRAASIGMKDTNFTNPSGLPDENHYSTAYDMALLAREAMQNEIFREIASKKTLRVEYGNPPYSRVLSNHNKLLGICEGCIGIKTGFTKAAGRCLVSAVDRESTTLICVTLNAPDDWNDHDKLYSYAFDEIVTINLNTVIDDLTLPVEGGEKDTLTLYAEPLCVRIPKGSEKSITRTIITEPKVTAPVKIGEVVGDMAFFIQGNEIARTQVLCAQSIGKSRKSQSAFRRFIKNIHTIIMSF